MEFDDVVRRRRMVRNYDPDRAVPDELVDRLLDYAIRAPSAGFSQGWGFLVLTDPAERAKFWDATTSADDAEEPDSWLIGLQRAPVLVIALSNKQIYLDRYAAADKGWTDRDEARWPVPYWDIDTGFAALMMMLGAVGNGLGTSSLGFLPEEMDKFR